jgi:hypothetical protein
MFQSTEITLGLCSRQFWIAQSIGDQRLNTSEDAAVILSGSQGFLALVAGLVLALAFQLLLTNFFIALGISYSDSEDQSDADSSDDASDTLENRINKIETVVGLRTLGTVSTGLFIACFLAVKLCQLDDVFLGAVLGLTIWGAYFSLLVWISSTTAGSLIGSVLDAATSGLQGIVGTATVALGAKTVSDQVVSSAETAVVAVRRELGSAVDSTSIRQAIDNYLKQLQLPEADRQEIRNEFEKLVVDPEMKSIARSNHLRNMGRRTFVDLVHSRTAFSKQDINQVVDQLDVVWQQIWGPQPQKALNGKGNELKPDQEEQLTPKLEQLIEETHKHQAQRRAEVAQKAAETAAWWLFATALTSAAASAIAPAIAISA